MDNSSIILDTSQFRSKVNDFLEQSLGVLSKRTTNVFKELDSLKEEYSSLIYKCNNYLTVS